MSNAQHGNAGMPQTPTIQTAQHVPPPPPGGHQGGSQAGSQGGAASQQNLNQIVLEYLSKKGYNRTEAMLRRESAHQDPEGRPIVTRAEDAGGEKYMRAFDLLRTWIEDNLDLYKAELRRLLWPVFVYSFLNLAAEFYPRECERFFNQYKDMFAREHQDDLRALSSIRLPEHLNSTIAKTYRSNRYRISLSTMAFNNLMQFLESRETEGGSVIVAVIQTWINLVPVNRAAGGGERSLAALLAQRGTDDELPAEDEGIPGHNPGSANTDRNAPPVLPKLSLGPLPLDQDAMEDVRATLQEEDARNPPSHGQSSLVEELEHRIKTEPTDDGPTRDQVPLPPALARDVAMEVQKIKENRDRFKIETRNGGVGPGVSVTMYTFHNTFDSINCIDFSGDYKLVAVGTAESYIRVWSLEGKALPNLPTLNPSDPHPKPSSSRRLVGHSGPVYTVAFSPATPKPSPDSVSTDPRYLLSCSADKTIRLWSLDTWTCLVAYKSHESPVWDVAWGPYGHYFVSGSHDRTARLWVTDNIAPVRIFVGHDNDVDCVTFHPNSAYVFTGSSDKTIRMWDINRGMPLRMFTGHTSNITAITCAPNGQTLASADDAGNIILWDLAKGSRIKRMCGHARGGIWSLSWSVESTVLVSGGADGTVRVWDCVQQTAESAATNGVTGKAIADGGTGTKIDSAGVNGTAGTGPVGKKAKAKDNIVTGDQISAFPTKKSPVYKVKFTRMNLVMAGGAYMP